MTVVPPEQPHVVGPGLVLRPWRPGDEEALVSGLDDPAIERFMNTIPYPYSPADADEWVRGGAAGAWSQGGADFAVETGDGLARGALGIRRVAPA